MLARELGEVVDHLVAVRVEAAQEAGPARRAERAGAERVREADALRWRGGRCSASSETDGRRRSCSPSAGRRRARRRRWADASARTPRRAPRLPRPRWSAGTAAGSRVPSSSPVGGQAAALRHARPSGRAGPAGIARRARSALWVKACRGLPPHPHSARSAITGSSREARRAGRKAASVAIASSTGDGGEVGGQVKRADAEQARPLMPRADRSASGSPRPGRGTPGPALRA